MNHRIIVTKRINDYHAHLEGHPEIWGCGKNQAEAVGELITTHAEQLDMKVTSTGGNRVVTNKDTPARLLFELALHLKHDSGLRTKMAGTPVGILAIVNEEGALWKRIVDCLGFEPDMIRDVQAPAIKRALISGR